MPISFLRTNNTRQRRWGLITASLIIAAGLTWAFLPPLVVNETITPARLEVDRAVHVAAAAVSGRTALSQRLEALEAEIEGAERSLREAHRTAQAAFETTNAHIQEAKAAAQAATRESQRAELMHKRGIVSDAELHNAQTEARQGWAALGRLRITAQRQLSEHQTQRRGHQANLERLKRKRAELKREPVVSRTEVERITRNIDHQRTYAMHSENPN